MPSEPPNPNQTCIVSVNFTPQFAGSRWGAVPLADGNGNLFGIGYLSGTGKAPEVVFSGSSLSTVALGFAQAFAVALDGAGNIYVADRYGPAVYKIAPGGAKTALGSGWEQPYAIAADGAGSVIVLDVQAGTVVKLTPSGTQTTVPYSFSAPYCMTVVGAGNIYVGDPLESSIFQISPSGVETTISGFNEPATVTADFAGNLFLVDPGLGGIYKVPPGGSPTLVTNALSGGVTGMTSALSGASPAGLALDVYGNLYIANSNFDGEQPRSTLVMLARATAPSVTFQTATPVGTIDTTDGPQTVSLFNIGNKSLNFATPTSGTNPSYPANFPVNSSDGSLCNSGT